MYGQEMRWNFPGRRRRILAFSDLHFCKKLTDKRLNFILERLCRVCRLEKIDYIFYLGDLINSLDVLKDEVERARLEGFLTKLADLAPLTMVTGNHDITYYTLGANRGIMRAQEWYEWVRKLTKNKRIIVLDEALGLEKSIYDDGVMRILGMTLPEKCYATVTDREQASAKTFRTYAERVLPELTRVPGREYYLLLHAPQFLSELELDNRIAVLAGHMHNGMVPPGLDELTKFSDRGLVGPGYYNRRGRKVGLFPLASSARYRPSLQHPWLTLNSCAHLPPESWLWALDGVYPACSYAVIASDEGSQMRLSNKYLR